jgi:SAM-dependent methyltransferase
MHTFASGRVPGGQGAAGSEVCGWLRSRVWILFDSAERSSAARVSPAIRVTAMPARSNVSIAPSITPGAVTGFLASAIFRARVARRREKCCDRSLVLFSENLTPADAAILETFVVPRYLSLFGDLLQQMVLLGASPRFLHLGCRTGYPDLKLYQRADGAEILGVDASLPAIDLARNKAAVLGDVRIEYQLAEALPLSVEDGMYTHAFTIHPLLDASGRAQVFSEMARVLCPGGQALVAMPLRGSFLEIADLFREYALKHDDSEFAKLVETAFLRVPNLEVLSEELENAGLDDVDIEVRRSELSFDSGRAFVEDPVSRLLILPEIQSWLGHTDFTRPLEYLRDAIDKYWSEGKFELSLNVGCASARKP